jgi:molecular chaperone GrpE
MNDQDVSRLSTSEETATALERERDDMRDRWLRTAADFDNYRKRIERERRDLSDAVTAEIVRDILPVVDDLERALGAPASDPAADSYRRGVELIHRRLVDVLKKRGVEPLDVVGATFDPNWHESVAQDTAAGVPDGQITAELRRGYRIGQRLLRPAQVRVAKA